MLSVVDGAPGMGAACVRALLGGLAAVHRVVLEVWLATYRVGLARVTRLPATVIAFGNLSMGGTGKTLAVCRLAREMAATGKRVAILSRGYGRASREDQVVLFTPDAPPRESPLMVGDEPYLLAASLPGIPVLVGKNRRRTGRRAIDEFAAEVLLLDDGFQYWRLWKDREIVLIDALQPAGRAHLFPRGLLREPWSHLARAQEVWITHAHLAPPARVAELAALVRRHAPHAQLRYTEHRPLCLRAPDGTTAPLSRLQDQPVLALSGLGHPEQFEQMLATLGARVTPCRFPDHHVYTPEELAALAAHLPPGACVVTTAKDALRLPADLPFPLWVVEVEMAEVGIGD